MYFFYSIVFVVFVFKCVLVFCFSGKPVMIITEYMENGSLDTFLKVGQEGYKDSNEW